MSDDPRMGSYTAAEKTRIAGIHARMRSHDIAVKAGADKIGGEPEYIEYLARWQAFAAEMNKLGECANADSWWSSNSGLFGDGDKITSAEARLNLLIFEWDHQLDPRIQIRRKQAQIDSLQTAVDAEKAKKVPPSTIQLPDTKTSIGQSPASTTYVPQPKDEKKDSDSVLPVEAKYALVGGALLGTVIGAIAVKGDATKAVVAGGGSLATAGLALLLFGGLTVAKKDDAKKTTDALAAAVTPKVGP